ncbi:hypothetical protein KL921_003411 [Ogataea angusta]|uniref:Uncharacterized protein n=1 Tax=Pichia angusta TaxID=870730 RepID=A0AAN6DFF9_PICAN|nr:uncharacterized protein KL928_003646 [Ogataea angusta]KAG7809414.1 hypothetical protein KL921_003411 [Ogataea angusta]KAG7817747.1 hypothetical protein KL928_003646 [Ogataea angusta]KAG7822698.1 hypothetical protein KL909_003863 [Ogataea angusta]KAG7833647.1 hypothetical protein KL943_003755 [Ogataea angusta]KAG7839652.1 hypothetical protein KL942_003263 [Ogataea angusta]
MLSNLAGWALFGAFARAYQQALRNLSFTYAPMGYVYSTGAWVGFGYLFEKWVRNNDEIIEERLKKLKEQRQKTA